MPVASLVPYAANARTHSPAQVAQIAASIAEFGFVNPVLVDAEGVLIAGHGRVLAAKQLGMASVPVLRLGHLTEAQARALRLADNQIALNSGWDEALLAAEIARIRDEAVVDLDVLGFSGMELDQLLAAADAGSSETPMRRRRRRRCRSPAPATSGAAASTGCCAAMPPSWRTCSARSAPVAWPTWPSSTRPIMSPTRAARRRKMTIANDALGGGFVDFLRPALANLLSVTKGACYVCMSSSEWPTLHRAWQEAGGKWSSTIIWAKNTFTLGRADYQQQYEAMLYGWKAGAQHYWCGARDQGECLALRQAGAERPSPDDEAGRAGRARDPQQQQAARHRAGPVRRLRHDDDRRGADGAPGCAAGDRPGLCRCHRPALAGGDR